MRFLALTKYEPCRRTLAFRLYSLYSRSIKDKIKLSKMFGVNSLSVWRIGAIPNGTAEQYMNVWDVIDTE